MMVELMVPPQTFFQKSCPSPALRFDDKDRYQTKVTAEAALIAELHSFIATSELLQFLEKRTMVVLILWINDIVMESAIHRDLRL